MNIIIDFKKEIEKLLDEKNKIEKLYKKGLITLVQFDTWNYENNTTYLIEDKITNCTIIINKRR